MKKGKGGAATNNSGGQPDKIENEYRILNDFLEELQMEGEDNVVRRKNKIGQAMKVYLKPEEKKVENKAPQNGAAKLNLHSTEAFPNLLNPK